MGRISVWIIFVLNIILGCAVVISPYVTGVDWKLIGNQLGDISVIAFGLTLVPGILQRFGAVRRYAPIYAFLKLIRRQLGIFVFVSALAHTVWSYVLPAHTLIPIRMSDWMGAVALAVFFVLFLTSNDQLQSRLSHAWNTLHSLVHVMIWLVLLHIVLKANIQWSLITGMVILADVGSWIKHLARET